MTASEGRRFAFAVGAAFAALGALLLWRGRERFAAVLLITGGLLFTAGLVIPTRLGPVERAWMGVAHAISKVTTPVFMTVTYFLVLVPVGLLRRAVARNPLRRDPASSSYWVRHESREAESLRRQF
ncbi:MAG: SxtJ family membrane protein [Gemmatimonadales bacterium]